MFIARRTYLVTHALIAIMLCVTAALYWPALHGPYLFDDFWNLSATEKWFAGEVTWRQSLLPNQQSIIESRPFAMASFMLTTWLGGIGTFPSKLGNLVLHLVCGWLVWHVAQRLIALDSRLAKFASKLALIVAAIWLLHPLHVSTVLYAVQRMSQLAAIPVLLCVLTYLSARRSLDAGRTRDAGIRLFLMFPLLLLVGVLSKQNAVVAPALCLAIECALTRTSLNATGRKLLGGFYLIFLALPAALVVIYLSLNPGYVLDGYRDWDFSLQQRLLTQPRVLLDYIGSILVPYSPGMGLYTDDFSVSTGWLQPASTVAAVVLLVGVSWLTWLKRAAYPLAFVGWSFFLIAHSVEASFLALEMYYEHRNYLPSVGLLLALAGLLGPLLARQANTAPQKSRLWLVASIAFVAVLAIATFGRVLVWQSFDTIVAQGVAQHPRSIRAASDSAWLALERKQFQQARDAMRPLVESGDPRARIFGRLQLAAIDCYEGGEVDRSQLEFAVSEAMSKATVYEAQVIKMFDNATLFGQCTSMPEVFAAASQRIMDAATEQPESNRNKYVPREVIARLYARGGDWTQAEHQAELSWAGGNNPPTGALLAQIYLRNGKAAEARQLIEVLESMIPQGDLGGQAALQQLRVKLGDAEAAGETPDP